MRLAVVKQCVSATVKVDSGHPLVRLSLKYFYYTDFTAKGRVGTAACTAVKGIFRIAHRDNYDISIYLFVNCFSKWHIISHLN